MTAANLITALYEGRILKKVHYNDENCAEFLFMEVDCGRRHLGMRGWATAHGEVGSRLEKLVTEPEEWTIVEGRSMSDGYPYPWSSN